MKNINLKKKSISISILVFLVSISSFSVLNMKIDSIKSSSRGLRPAQSDHRLTVATSAPVGDWDPAIGSGWSVISQYYLESSLESLFWFSEDSTEFKPNLATSWAFEYWPEETNALGWNNTGGIKSINITLRYGVTFHDGSDWNATVAKWNIDRYYLITGNLTGKGDMRNMGYYFPEVAKTAEFFTPSWNNSEFDKPGLISPAIPNPDDYTAYYIGIGTTYPGVNNIGGWVKNPNPFGGYDFWGNSIHYAPYDRYPLIRYVEILENIKSGGTIRVHYNSWNPYGMEGGLDTPMISHKAYAQDYTGSGIYGYQNGVKDPKNPTVVDHLIGTSAYIYVESDEDGGYMIKNNNYWNKTALEAKGWFDADRIDFVNFPTSPAGEVAMNNALLSHAADYVFDSESMRMDYDAIIGNHRINYIETGVEDYLNQITLNSINETWWAWPDVGLTTIADYYPNEQGKVNGQPQALRKALSFAFDYDHVIDVALEGRVVRQGGIVGQNNLYYNSSVPQAYFNVSYAREILLTTETDTSGKVFTAMGLTYGYSPNPDLYNFSKRCADRGLNAGSSDAEWKAVAEGSDPIWTIDFYWDVVSNKTLKPEFLKTCNRLGVALTDPTGATNLVSPRIWDVVQVYWAISFATGSSIWSAGAWPMPYYMPATATEAYIEFWMRDPDDGLWRTLGAGGITSLWPAWNFGFTYDDEVNAAIDRMWMSNPDLKSKWISKIAKIEQTQNYPYIYGYQHKTGIVLWDDWKVNLDRGSLFFANYQYVKDSPGDFTLVSDANTPDTDGNFNLSWTTSVGADNYSIYRYNKPITQINGTLTEIAFQNATSPLLISGLSNGEYFFIIVAHNQYNDTLSNDLIILIQLSGEPTGPEIPGYNLIIIFSITLLTSVILIKTIKRKYKTYLTN